MTFVERYGAPMIWFVVLVAGLVWYCLPLDTQPGWPVVLGIVLVTAGVATALPACGRRRAAPVPHAEPVLRLADMRALPVILVAGPHAAMAFARGATLRRSGEAVWLLVRTADDLAGAFEAVRESHQRFPDAVLIPLLVDAAGDEAGMRRDFGQWRRVLDAGMRYRACTLPCHVAIYAGLGHAGAAAPAWFGELDMMLARPDHERAHRLVRMLRRRFDHAWLAAAGRGVAARAALGHAVFDWLEDTALLSTLTSLANTAPFSLHGLLLADIGGSPSDHAGAWTRWLTSRTSLRPSPLVRQAASLPLPAIVLRQAGGFVRPARGGGADDADDTASGPRWRVAHAVAAVATTLAVAICVSAWQNDRLVDRVGRALDAYRETPAIRLDAKRERLDALRERYAELDRYAHTGVPTGLGWGLYRGAPLRVALAHAIASWRPPANGVTLDELSLFDSGKATLKADAIPKLRGVLGLILANPDRRILIAGHTDDVGAAAANLKLSEARARAIRDWFTRVASLPVTRFAIQGYGDTRPIADNHTPQGRAKNRRVEILLVPDPGAHE